MGDGLARACLRLASPQDRYNMNTTSFIVGFVLTASILVVIVMTLQ